MESELVDQLSQEARWEKDLQDADSAWGKYLHRNKSVIVDTFQGQFKSTVSITLNLINLHLYKQCLDVTVK